MKGFKGFAKVKKIGLLFFIFVFAFYNIAPIRIARAAVANDAASESHTGTTGSASQASFTWTHTPVGTPRGVLVFVYTISATDKTTSVTYGGTTMTRVTGGAAIDTATEPGRVDTFFLGASIPTGAQSVVVNRTNDATVMYAVAVTQTAAANTEVTGIVLLQENQAPAQRSVTDGSTGVDSVRYAGAYYGGALPPVTGGSSTLLHDIDLGAFGVSTVRETTAGQGARLVGFTDVSDDLAAVHLAVREVSATTLTISKTAGSVVATKNSGDTGQYAHDTACTSATNCAAFTLLPSGGNVNLTSIKISEVGTAAANTDLANGKLYYDTNGNWADAEVETQYGATSATFDASQTATFSAALSLTSGTTYYFYVGYDVKSATPTYPKGGQTVSFSIAANGDVVSDGTETGAAQTLNGTQTVLPNATSVTYTVNADGGRSGDSVTVSGFGFGVPTAANRNNCTTATVDIGCVKFTVGGATYVPSSDFTSWSNTSIVFIGSTTLVTEGGASAIEVRAANQADATKLTYYLYPKVTTIDITANGAATGTCGVTPCNTITSARQTDTIRINGDHLGGYSGAGSSTITVNGTAISGTPQWNGSSTIITGSVINGGTDTGNVTLVRNSDSKSSNATSGTFTILPRVTSIDITANGAGTGTCGSPPCNGITSARQTDTIRINGDHFGSSTGTTTVNGTNSTGALTWSATQISGSVIAGGTDTGNVVVTRLSDATTSNSSSGTFTILPFVSGTTVCNKVTYPSWPTDGARQYSSGDADCPNGLKDGHVQLNGNHFGTAGTITLIGTTTTQVIVGSNCSSSAYTSTCAMVQTPTDIANATYTGNFVLTRTADSKTSTYAGFRILPRIASTGPVSLKGGRGDSISFTGDHLCQSGTCPTSNGSSSYATFVGGNVYSGNSTWTDISNPAVVIPGAAADGTTSIVSNTSYASNYLTYDVKLKPDVSSSTGRSPANAATGQSQNLSITGAAFADSSGDSDTFVSSNWELARNSDVDGANAAYATPEWSATTSGTTTTVNTTNGTFANDDSGKTKLECNTVYKWHYRYKDNGGISSAEWSLFSNDFTFTTTACIPDATSLTNNTEGGLTDGGRGGQSITLTGTSFGTATAGNRATCGGGAGTGCIKIGGAGGYLVPDGNVTAWSATSITFTLPAASTSYGGATTTGIMVYSVSVSDADGLTGYVYPQVTSLSVSSAAEGDTLTINGNHFGTGAGANTVKIDSVVATGCTWSETSLTGCVVPDIPDADDSVTVRVYQGTGGNNALFHDYGTPLTVLPKITSISAASFSDGGYQDGTFTLNGSHFGSSQGTGNASVNGATQDGTLTWGVSTISGVGIPNGGTDSGSVTVTRGDGQTSAAWSTFYIYPQISSFASAQSAGDYQTGSTTISGNHFGTSGTTTNITINGANPSFFSSWSSTSLASVDIPNGGTDSGTITVTNPQTSKASNTSSTFYIYPNIISTTVSSGFSVDTSREYNASDYEGVIIINGTHFGTSGTTTVLSTTATQVGTSSCSAYAATCAGVQIPAAISNSTYTGSVFVGRGDGKSDTYAGFRILPRITSTSPTTGLIGDKVKIVGDHLCESGTCPVSPNRSNATDNVKFGSTQAANGDFINAGGSPCSSLTQAWGDSEICVDVPAATSAGSQPIVVTSNTSYTSNSSAFTRSSTVPNDPDVGPGTNKGQYRSDDNSTAIGIGGTYNQTSIMTQITMSTANNGTTTLLIPEIELKAIATAFDGTGLIAGTSVSYVAGAAAVTGTTTVTGLSNGTSYHWRGRVKNNSTAETSNWVSFGGQAESVADVAIDTAAPTISAVSSGTPIDISTTATWTTGSSSNTAVTFGTNTCIVGSGNPTTTSNSSNVSSHSIALNALVPSTAYYYRVKSTDVGSNTAYDPSSIASNPGNCRTFTTAAPVKRLLKTTDFFVFQNNTSGAPGGGTTTNNYDVFVAEYDAGNSRSVVHQSAYVEIYGIAVASSSYSIAVRANNDYTTYTFPSTGGVPLYFSMIHKVNSLNYDYPSDASANNVLEYSFPSAPTSISALGARQYFTYYYTP